MTECENVEIEIIRQKPPGDPAEIRCSMIHESIVQDVRIDQAVQIKWCLEDKVLCHEVAGNNDIMFLQSSQYSTKK